MKLLLTRPCVMCKKDVSFEVEKEDYFKFASGELHVQTAFPYLSAGLREMLLSGICPACFKLAFGEDEE